MTWPGPADQTHRIHPNSLNLLNSTFIVTLQQRAIWDSICNSCNVYSKHWISLSILLYMCVSVPLWQSSGGLIWTQEHFLRRISIWFSTLHTHLLSSLQITSRSSEKYIFTSSTAMLYYKIHNLMFITQNNDPLITLSHISRPSLDLYHCWCWTMKSFHKFAFNGFLECGSLCSHNIHHFCHFMGKSRFSPKKRQHEFVLSHFRAAIITSADGHFCHFRCFVQSFHRSVVLSPRQAKPRSDLVLDVLLADEDEKHEEATKQVEAVDHPEEDL